MEIVIKRKKTFLRAQYEVHNKEGIIYTASRSILNFFSEITLMEKGSSRPRMIIKENSGRSFSYDITRWDNNVLQIRPADNCYDCYCGDDLYKLYRNKGRKYSIYKNDVQVAWWDKNANSILGENFYTIIADKDADADLIISLCLVVDNGSGRGGTGSIFSTDLGYFGEEAKEFDDKWQPKN